MFQFLKKLFSKKVINMPDPVNLMLDEIRKSEGFSAKPYWDKKQWSIGYGHGITEEEAKQYAKNPIDQKRAEAWAMKDALKHLDNVEKNVKVALNPYQKATMALHSYNKGPAAFSGSTMVKLLNEGKYEEVPSQLMNWIYITDSNGTKVPSEGLKRRAQGWVDLWNTEQNLGLLNIPKKPQNPGLLPLSMRPGYKNPLKLKP